MRLGLRLPEISSGRTQGQKLKEEEYWGEVRGCRGYKMRLVLTWQGSGRTALGLMEQTAPEAFLPFLLQLLLPNHQVSLHAFNFAFLLFFFSLFFSLTLPCFLEVLLVGTAFNSHGKSSKKCCYLVLQSYLPHFLLQEMFKLLTSGFVDRAVWKNWTCWSQIMKVFTKQTAVHTGTQALLKALM